MNIEEGWAHYQEAMGEISSLLGEEVAEMLTASLRAFGLAAHVDACHEIAKAGEYEPGTGGICGDGWLCDKAKEIERLA